MRHSNRWWLTVASFTVAASALGAPGDAPTAGADPVQVDSGAPHPGDGGLVSASGEASWRVPFEVPPGRNGAQPTIALEYSSRASLRGGIAAGWTLPVSTIHVDTRYGRAGGVHYAIDGVALIPSNEPPITATATTYRAEGDSSYTIYEHVSDGSETGYWYAHSPDGSLRIFGTDNDAKDLRTDAGAQFGGQGRWFLNRSIDARGNAIDYVYETVYGSAHDGALANTPIDVDLVEIDYGRNSNVTASRNFVAIKLQYAPMELCPGSAIPIGAQFDFSTGIRRYRGAKRLVSIRSSVLDSTTNTWMLRRELAPQYDATAMACGQTHAPLRMITGAQLRAWDASGNLVQPPPIKFTYGPLDYDFADTGTKAGGNYAEGWPLTSQDGKSTYAFDTTVSADINGNGNDGMDLLYPSPLASGGCTLNGIAVPGIPWANGSSPVSTYDQLEACSAGLQLARRPYDAAGTVCGASEQMNQASFLDLTGDGLPDLVTQLSYTNPGAYDPALDTTLENQINPLHITDYPACSNMPLQPCTAADGSPSACLLDNSQRLVGSGDPTRVLGIQRGNGSLVMYTDQYEPCATVPDLRCGYYVLRMYKNLGNGAFATTPTMVYSPVPLATVSGSTEWGHGALASGPEAYTYADLDGDGRLDAVYYQATSTSGNPQLSVWCGNGNGFNAPRLDWATPGLTALEKHGGTSYSTNGYVYSVDGVTSTLKDINGDGLPDLVLWNQTTNRLTARFNTGNGFETVATALEVVNPNNMNQKLTWPSATVTVALGQDSNYVIDDGYVVAVRRMLDLDGDGLPDVAAMPQPVGGQTGPAVNGASVVAWVNLGDKLMPTTMSASAASIWFASLSNIKGYHDSGAWHVATDVVDADGDGLPEVQQLAAGECTDPNFGTGACGGSAHTWKAKPLAYRLLTSVDNGYGVVTTFTYGSVRDSSLVTTTVHDGRHRIERPQQLVRQVDVTSASAPTATTTYAYQDPLTAADRFGRVDFRGFEQITTVGPASGSGARRTTITKYDYSLDPLGRVSEVLTLDNSTLVTVAQAKWHENDVFNTLPSFVESEKLTYHCNPRTETTAAQESDCVQKDTAGLEHHVSTWTPVHIGDGDIAWNAAPTTGAIAAWVPTIDRRSAAAPASGDRADATSYHVFAGNQWTKQWMIRPTETVTLQATNATNLTGATTLAHAKTIYDTGGLGLPIETQVEMRPGVFARTTRTFDGYGNVATLMRPNQVALGSAGKSASHVYDALGAYAIASIDELGHRVEHDWDLAFGKTVAERGPQQGAVMPYDNVTYDALGRAVQRNRLGANANGSTFDFVYFTAAYNDAPTSHSQTLSLRSDYSNAVWKVETDLLDGFGRTVQKQLVASPTTSEVTTYHYDAAGNVVATDVPNPAGSPATVTYATTYDSLGRQTRYQAPGQAVVVTYYSGMTTEVVNGPTDDSVQYVKVMNHDPFGRLTRVIEGETTHATTLYSYDALDRMTRITDADNVISTMSYALGGQRASITRGSSTLSYDYDLDSNQLAMHHPRPSGTPDAAAWTSTWSYDALDRVAVSLPATRDLTGAAQARYADGATVLTYDEPARKFGVGRLTTATYPFGIVAYDYSIEGWAAGETRNLQVAPDGTAFAATGTQKTAYNPLASPVMITYPDDATVPTSARFVYDLQARPARLDVGTNGNNFRIGVANFSRNAAGYVVTRTATGNSTAEQAFDYDTVGRVTKEWINGLLAAGGTMTALAGEGFVFRQDGSVKTFGDRASNRNITLGFDDLQQLTSAVASDYSAVYTYSPAGTIKSANVQSTIAGAQVANRNVSYDFTPATGDVADPAAVRKLVATGGATFASLSYDASSNLKQRSVGGTLTTFSYDGFDRLREAQTASGDEVYFYDFTGTRILTYRAPSGDKPAQLVHRFGSTEIVTDAQGARATTTDVVFGGYPQARVVNHDITTPFTLYHGVLGNLMAVLDSNKVLFARFSYDPYGDLLAADGPSFASFDRTYEGKPRDAASGLSYFGHRYYDPITLTWTQADPLSRFAPDVARAQPRRMNLFSFALNSPLRYVDPNGLSPNTNGDPVGKSNFPCRAMDGCGPGAGGGASGIASMGTQQQQQQQQDSRLDQYSCSGRACTWDDVISGTAVPLTAWASDIEFKLYAMSHWGVTTPPPNAEKLSCYKSGATQPAKPATQPTIYGPSKEERERIEEYSDWMREVLKDFGSKEVENQNTAFDLIGSFTSAYETHHKWREAMERGEWDFYFPEYP